jgi:hypothetical protein
MEQRLKNRVSGIEDKVEELDQLDKVKEKILGKYEQNMQDLWDTIERPNLQITGTEKKEKSTS